MMKPQSLAFLSGLCSRGFSWMFGSGSAKTAPTGMIGQDILRDVDLASDPTGAVERTRIAARNGDPVAQNSLGVQLAFRQGILRNDLEARKWLSRAAAQGYAEAQFNLGNSWQSSSLQRRATESCEERIEAYTWFHIAAAQGHVGAEAACETLNLQLTDAELNEGNRRAQAFQSKKELAGAQLNEMEITDRS